MLRPALGRPPGGKQIRWWRGTEQGGEGEGEEGVRIFLTVCVWRAQLLGRGRPRSSLSPLKRLDGDVGCCCLTAAVGALG